MLNDIQKEWLDETDDVLNQFKELVKHGEKLSFYHAIALADGINSSLNDERLRPMWTTESQEKWNEIKYLFSLLVEPAYYVSGNQLSSVN